MVTMSAPILAVCSDCHTVYVTKTVTGVPRPEPRVRRTDQTVCPRCSTGRRPFTIDDDVLTFTSQLAAGADVGTQQLVASVIKANQDAGFDELTEKIKEADPEIGAALGEYAAAQKGWTRVEKMTLVSLFFAALTICISIYSLALASNSPPPPPQPVPGPVKELLIEEVSSNRCIIVLSEQQLTVKIFGMSVDFDRGHGIDRTRHRGMEI